MTARNDAETLKSGDSGCESAPWALENEALIRRLRVLRPLWFSVNLFTIRRVIDMYEAAIQEDVRLADRTGHWVHRYFRDVDVLQFISNQFGDVERIKSLLAQWRAS